MSFTRTQKILAANFSALSFLKIANYLLPMVALPYLLRIIGPERFGLVFYAQAVITYFIVITEYGFNLSATKDISLARGDVGKLSKIFTEVIASKLLLVFFCLIVLVIAATFLPKIKDNAIVYYFTFGSVLANALFPVWFYLGTEKMVFITVFTVLSKLTFTLLIFFFIKVESDYVYVPLIRSLGDIFASWVSFLAVILRFRVQPVRIHFREIYQCLKSSWHIFASKVFVNLYSSTNTIILGIFTNNAVVGYYSIALKIYSALNGLSTPINTTVFPYLAVTYEKSRAQYYDFLKKMILLLGTVLLIISFSTYSFSEIIIKLVAGEELPRSVTVLRILAWGILFSSFGSLFSQVLIIQDKQSVLLRIVSFTAAVNFVSVILVVPLFEEVGLALATVFVQIFVIATLCLHFIKSGEWDRVQAS